MISRHLLSCILLLAICSAASAQTYTIQGRVTDTLNFKQLRFASVTLIRASDSVLETFARTREDGSFQLHPRKAGKYVLMASFPGFVEFVDIVKLSDEKPAADLGQIAMISRSKLLQEVILTGQVAAIKIKGDTTEYVADSFKVKDNATVEDLLKKLPGIQVDRNGQITAQGEKVQKILVDGEEFFSDDPAVVTKNLQSNAVDKVQVFDKKSEQAEFTGIDDGQKTKTINLQLKEDKKKGYFGKLAGGGGTDQYWENQGMINAFKGKRKLSVFGIMANTGKIGLGWEDKNKYSDNDMNTVMSDDGGIMTYFTNDGDDDGLSQSWNGNYNGEGLPTSWTGGLHYSNKWGGEKGHLAGNYRYGKQNLETEGSTFTQYNIPGSTYYTNEKRNQFSTAQRHNGDGMYEWKYDSLSSLKLKANGGYSETQSFNNYSTESKDSMGRRLNDGYRNMNNDVTGTTFNATLDWKKKFLKKGRTLIVSASTKNKKTDGKGILYSLNNFYTKDTLTGNLAIDQHKETFTNLTQFSGSANYTEPLQKDKIFLELDYTLSLNNNKARRLSYNKTSGDSYDSLNSANSSDYDFDVLTHRAGTKVRFVYKKFNFSLGGDVGFTRFNQRDNLHDTSYLRNYTNLFPQASFTYKMGKQTSLRLNYYGNTRQPSINQIQPLQQNTDPLNVAIGNPTLKQEFDHQAYLSFNDYKVLTGTYKYLGGGLTFTNNAISQAEMVNSFGARTYQYINVNGNYSGWLYAGYGFKIKKPEINMRVSANANTSHLNNYVNGLKNVSNNNVYTLELAVDKSVEKKWEVSFQPSISYNNNTSSINGNSTNYFSSNTRMDFSYQLPKKLEIGTDINWLIRQKTVVFDRNNNVLRWNAYVSKKFLKNDQLELRASVFDILNQNIGYSRMGQSNTIVENNYNTIRRYGMLSLIWNFTKSPVSAPEAEEGTTIINVN